MATQVAGNPRWSQNASGRIMSHSNDLVETGETFKSGEFCRKASDGLMYEAVTGVTSVAASATTHYALEDLDATIGNSTTRKQFGVVAASDEYEMNELDGTVAEVTEGNHYEIDVTSNVCTLDLGNTNFPTFQLVTPLWRIREFQDTSSDTLARVIAKPLTINIEAAPAA